MPRKNITVAFVKRAAPPTDKKQVDYWDTVLPSFGLRVSMGGTKTFMVAPKVLTNGVWKKRRINLGRATEITLAIARERAREAIATAAEGGNPAKVRTEAREQQAQTSLNTFAHVLERFPSEYRAGRRSKRRMLSESTSREVVRALSKPPFTAWADRPITEITDQVVADAIGSLIRQGKDTAANRYLAYCRMVFRWAVSVKVITTDPTKGIEAVGIEDSRERVLDAGELAAVWQATAPTQANKGDQFAGIIKVLILTGQRRSEVAGMRWSELDLDRTDPVWIIPSTRSKNRREHIVPLSAPVVAILDARKHDQAIMGLTTDLVFTTTGKTAFSGFSHSKKRLDGRAGVNGWTIHDLRRSVVTQMNEDLRIQPHIVEAVVNHRSGAATAGVAGVYNRAQYLDERRDALNAWAAHLLAIVGEAEHSNVVPLRAAR